MGRIGRQEILKNLMKKAEVQGYITFDNIMDCADDNSLPIQDFDWLSNEIATRGVIVYDDAPKNQVELNNDNEFYDYAQIDYENVYYRIIELNNSLEDFVNKVRNIIPPQRKELSKLEYQVLEGNQHARCRMIEMHLRIALKLALQRAEIYDADIVETVGDACVGLVIAVDKYNPDVNGAFGSYATMWILQNISRCQPTKRPLIYYPVHKKEFYFSVYPFLKESRAKEKKGLCDAEEKKELLRKKFDFTDEQIDEVLKEATPLESFEEIFSKYRSGYYQDDFEKERIELFFDNFICELTPADIVDHQALREQLKITLNQLKEREKKVLELRFGLIDGRERTLEEVGKKFGVTRERVRQIENKALRKLKDTNILELLQQNMY